MQDNYLIIDVAAAPIEGAADYLDPVTAPSNYGAEAAAKYITKKSSEQVDRAALDLDLARLTAIGILAPDSEPEVAMPKTEAQERTMLAWAALLIQRQPKPVLVTYNGHSYDLELLQRRAVYLDVPFPTLNTDRYRSTNIDVLAVLSKHDPSRRRSLGFYARRFGWTDLVKPMSGEAESRVHDTGDWAGLEASVRHDLLATQRLAQRFRLIA